MKVYFMNPYYTVTNPSLQIGAVAPIKLRNSFFGVVSYFFEVGVLTDTINAIQILTHGYCFVVSRSNTSLAIVHPNFKESCFLVSCLESAFSVAEYNRFYADILFPLQAHGYTNVKQYIKGGEDWRLEYHEVSYGTIDYILLATVPQSDIKSTSQDVEKNIDRAVGKMVIALAISGAVLFLIIVYVSKRVVDNVVYPLEMLRRLCQAILRHDLSANIALQGTSADMTVLLETFSSFLIAIRFSSTSADSIRDHPEKCKYIFDQALEVFESTGNKRGAGACLNNLGSVYFSNSNLPRAADYFDRSIANAKSLLEKSSSESERENLRKILSDRLYNSSLVLIERGRFPEAFGVLEEASKEDLRNGYIRGYISKQIAIGQLQLKQGENGTAVRLFQNVLTFFNEVQDSPIQLDKREVMIARQMALRNMGYFYESTANFRAAEYYYLQALCRFTSMHVGTTKKTALSLLNIWGRSGNEVDKIRVLTRLCKRFNLDIDDSRAQRALVPKRVVFAMDYSGSMSGDKIRTAVSSLLNFYDKYIREDDSCALIVFNHKAVEAVKLNKKRLGGDRMRKKISALTAPHGGTALFAAIVISVETLGDIGGNDWVVALTDGQDNGDKSPLLKLLRESSVGLIVIGVGEDVEENVLIELCEAVSEQKGHYVSATSDPRSIEAAFNQVADIIQTDVVFQDIY